jgi:hypothetical protein
VCPEGGQRAQGRRRYQRTVKRLYFRGDAALGNPQTYEFLETREQMFADILSLIARLWAPPALA